MCCSSNSDINNFAKYCFNKKVLLRERKRHTARRVASARYAGGWYPIESWWGGVPIQSWRGVPHPDMMGGTHSSHGGKGYPIQSWWGGNPSSHGGGGDTPSSHGRGYLGYPPHHPDLAGVPPPHSDLAGVPPPHPDLAGVPPPNRGVNWQTNWKQYLPPSFGCGR